MPQLKVVAESFVLLSSWTVTTGSNGSLYISSGPTTDSKNITFTYELPDDITVTSAKVHSEWGSPLSGFDTHTVNGMTPGDDGFVTVEIDPKATSINVNFVFKALGNTTSQGNRQGATEITDIYLLIEYEHNYIPPELLAYTDPTLTKGVTYVKAVHMTELHTNVNRVRVACKLPEYIFTTITSGVTGLGGWNNHVVEIRTALDEIGKAHDTWITLGANCPRADVLMQLRNVVQAVAMDYTPSDPDIPDIPDQAETLVLLDSYSGTKYKLYVTNGKLCMTSATDSTSANEFVFGDTSTGSYYKLHVVNGKLTMTSTTNPNDGKDHSQFTMLDISTNKYYKLYVANGNLTMTVINS